MATFDTEHRTPEAVERQLGTRAHRYPAVVVEDEHRVLGFARASPDASGAERAMRAFETLDCMIVERLLGADAKD